MLENCQSAQERWGGVSEIIDRWLKERQELIVDFCGITTSVDTFENIEEDGRAANLKDFCQILVDYVSAGHFEVYEQLMKEGQDFNDKQALREAANLYSCIDDTTEKLLDFNDKYLETDDLETLEDDLSKVGQFLETRFEAEDRMIEVLHVAHKDQVM